MALTVEDGTGLDNADSYISVADSNSVLGAEWAEDNTAKETALKAATAYIDLRYGKCLMGIPLANDQALEFPRAYLYDRYGRVIEGVPDDWKFAVCYYAEVSVARSLYPEVTPESRELGLKRKKVVVGPITTEKEYKDSLDITLAAQVSVSMRGDMLAKQYCARSGGGVVRN